MAATERWVRIRFERRTPLPPGLPELVEVITPRTNEACLTSAENLLAAIAVAEPFSLEITADHVARRFVLRAQTPGMRQHLEGQLGATYPQAGLRPIEAALDPALLGERQQVQRCTLEPRHAPYSPIR